MRWSSLALFLLTMAAGLAGGLLYTWVLDPIEWYDTTPDALRTEDKLVYLTFVGDLYAAEGDLSRAEDRLAMVGLEADGQVLAGLIEQYLDGGGQPDDVRNLARLAEALGASGGVLLVFGSPPTPSPEAATATPALPGASPTPVPTATPAPSFRLVEQTSVCAEPGRPGRIAVRVQDTAGDGLPGVEIVVSWLTGQDRFFTGLRPGEGAGYADFEMLPQVEYDVTLAGFKGDMARGLTADLSSGICPTGTVALDWRVTFQQAP
jgi:hypothetical protein